MQTVSTFSFSFVFYVFKLAVIEHAAIITLISMKLYSEASVYAAKKIFRGHN